MSAPARTNGRPGVLRPDNWMYDVANAIGSQATCKRCWANVMNATGAIQGHDNFHADADADLDRLTRHVAQLREQVHQLQSHEGA